MPKRANGDGSIYQRKDGTWRVRVTTGRNAGTGKPIYRDSYHKTQKAAREHLRHITAALDKGTYQEPSRMTVAQWLDVWQAEYLGGVKPNTRHLYGQTIANYIAPALGAVRLQSLRPHDVQKFYNTLLRERALSPKTIKNVHGIFHNALKQAVLLGYLPQNPSDNITLPRVERPDVQPMPAHVLPAFLQAIQGHEFEALYFVTVFTGLRQSEVLGLTWDCVDFTANTITLRRQLLRSKTKGEGFSLQPLKNDKPRKISPAQSVMHKLWSVKVSQAKMQKAAGDAWYNPDSFVFTNSLGGHFIRETVYKQYKRIVTELGYPALRFHDLRHTYAVNALRSGDDIKTVQGNLGHHTAAFTLDTYGHVTDEMRQDSADRMQQFIDSLAVKSA
ncbi:MAG: site-specific integrase [Oscillospiraceae bacterium]|nr:site-specific integrase [Oscillospiraceae bacterium]